MKSVNIYDELKEKYPEYLKPEIVAVRMEQSNDLVWLLVTVEETTEDGLKKNEEILELDLISNDEETGEPFFNPDDSVKNNVRRFLEEFSPFSIMMTTDLFHEKACTEISERYNKYGIDR